MRPTPAKQNMPRRILALLLLALMLSGLAIPVLAVSGSEGYVNNDEVHVRTGPGTGYASLRFGGSTDILLYRGQYVKILSTRKSSDGSIWRQIVFTYNGYNKLGFMRSDFITYLERDKDYDAYLTAQGFPDSYKPYLRALYAASGGKWTFVAHKTGLDWDRALENEATLGRSLVGGSDTSLRSTAPGAYNSETGIWREYEPGWYAASRDTVAFYLDPRTYLADGTCIAFEKLTGNASVTHQQLSRVLVGCKWATDRIIDEFLQAGAEADVSPIFLAVKARDELGTGATANASGYKLDDGVKYYNFFNIGAYGGSDPNYSGILYARSEGWDTSYKAILGGAEFIARRYIAQGQDTQYLQRFNLSEKNTFAHQYATDITYAYKGGWGTYTSYAENDLLDVSLVLSVPILDNMPSVTKLPTAQFEQEYDPDPAPEPKPDPDPAPEPKPDPDPTPEPDPEPEPEPPAVYDYVGRLNLRLTDSYLSGFSLGTPVKTLISQIKAVNQDASVTVTDGAGKSVSDSALVSTGQVLTIRDAAGTYTYTCVVYGDANGDGRIAATDLLAVKKHILKTKPLTGPYARAVTFSGRKIAATALLTVKKHILGTTPIMQK